MNSRASMVTRRAFMGALPAPNLGRGTHIGTAYARPASFPEFHHGHWPLSLSNQTVTGKPAKDLAIAAKSLAKCAKEYADV